MTSRENDLLQMSTPRIRSATDVFLYSVNGKCIKMHLIVPMR